MSVFWKLLLLFGLQFFSSVVTARIVEIQSVSYSAPSAKSRVIFNTSSSVARDVFFLNSPPRLVIDFKNTQLNTSLQQPPLNHPYFKKIRSGIQDKVNLRIVVDLKKAIQQKSFNLAPSNGKGARFVVNLFNQGTFQESPKKVRIARAAPISQTPKKITLAQTTLTTRTLAPESKKITRKPITRSVFNKKRNIIIAIDAGHGGIDGGAKGTHGTQEKKVVFAIAKKLAKLIDSQAGMKAVLIRKGDYYVRLRKRMEIARAAKADLFISLHADAFQDPKVRGASVYTLSRNGASSEAAHWLAHHENAADLVGGVSLDDKDDILASVLLDLSQNATKEASRNVASKVLKYFKTVSKLHKRTVQKAGFAVLKSPDIPSILIETAFISNPAEEKNLLSRSHQSKIATAVFKGVVSYFREYAPADTHMASTR